MGRTRRRTLTGGYVYEGSEGCVFVPELKSKSGFLKSAKYSSRSGKFVTKIFLRDADLKAEIEGLKLMKTIDPTGEYSKTFFDINETPDLSSKLPTENCTKAISDKSPTIYMYYGGISLQALRKNGKLNEVIKPVLVGLSKLGDLFVKMAKSNIFHKDIQPGNFLFNKQESKVYLIDFTAMSVIPGITDKAIDIRDLALVIFNILTDYRKQVMADSSCGDTLDFILTKSKKDILASKDPEVINTIIVSSVDSVMRTCFKGGKRKTLRRSRH